ncbi:hypothetical protein RV11_GL003109 [Enterococcus phoeniculicola]|jgi:hypothetical protein|nr:hypothetical protein [Enterococcus phoeniculicola]OJG72138.1 hypothetical protein RV11_GL003109 [Enterococcus phoeniculicola]
MEQNKRPFTLLSFYPVILIHNYTGCTIIGVDEKNSSASIFLKKEI